MSDHGVFYWNEPMTNDIEGAKAFYAATPGWTYAEFPGANLTYWDCMAADRPVGGIMPLEGFAPQGGRAARFCASRSTFRWSDVSPF